MQGYGDSRIEQPRFRHLEDGEAIGILPEGQKSRNLQLGRASSCHRSLPIKTSRFGIRELQNIITTSSGRLADQQDRIEVEVTTFRHCTTRMGRNHERTSRICQRCTKADVIHLELISRDLIHSYGWHLIDKSNLYNPSAVTTSPVSASPQWHQPVLSTDSGFPFKQKALPFNNIFKRHPAPAALELNFHHK